MCEYCEKQKILKPDKNVSVEMPYSGVMKINDSLQNREYLFSVGYCHVCGNKLKYSNYLQENKTDFCPFCEKGKRSFTDYASWSKADASLNIQGDGNRIMVINGDSSSSYCIECMYCPYCGKHLDRQLSSGRTMNQKLTIYIDDMCCPKQVRIVSEKLCMDYTFSPNASFQVVQYHDLLELMGSNLYDRIYVNFAEGAAYITDEKNNLITIAGWYELDPNQLTLKHISEFPGTGSSQVDKNTFV